MAGTTLCSREALVDGKDMEAKVVLPKVLQTTSRIKIPGQPMMNLACTSSPRCPSTTINKSGGRTWPVEILSLLSVLVLLLVLNEFLQQHLQALLLAMPLCMRAVPCGDSPMVGTWVVLLLALAKILLLLLVFLLVLMASPTNLHPLP